MQVLKNIAQNITAGELNKYLRPSDAKKKQTKSGIDSVQQKTFSQDTAEISAAALRLQEKDSVTQADESVSMDWLNITDRGNGKYTAHFTSAFDISRVLKLGYIMVNGQKVMLDKQQKKELHAAGKQMEKDRQNVMNQYMMEQQLASARQSSDSWKKSAQQQSRVLATAMRIMHGRNVSVTDEKELAEASPELYSMAKSASTLEKIKENQRQREEDRKVSEENDRQREWESEPRDYSAPPLSSYPTYETQIGLDFSSGEAKISAIGEAAVPPAET